MIGTVHWYDQVAKATVKWSRQWECFTTTLLHRCQPSRIRRDSPAFLSDVPRPAKWDRCPAFLENCIIFFAADYFTFLPCNATKWRTSNKARSILRTPTDAVYISRAAAAINDCSFLTPPAGSILLPLVTCHMGGGFRLDNRQRSSDNLRALFSIFSGMRWRSPRWKKWRRRENDDDWNRDFAWIAKLPDSCMAQCNMCVTDFSISSGGRTDVRRYHAKLALRRTVGWSSMSPMDKMNWVDGVTRAETMLAYWIAYHSSLGLSSAANWRSRLWMWIHAHPAIFRQTCSVLNIAI